MADLSGTPLVFRTAAKTIIRNWQWGVMTFVLPDGREIRLEGVEPGPEAGDLALFAHFHFPVSDLTKLDMARIAADEGFADILEQTWFCHTPLVGRRPCGYCVACVHTRSDGLVGRVPDPGPARRVERALTTRLRAAGRRLRRAVSA